MTATTSDDGPAARSSPRRGHRDIDWAQAVATVAWVPEEHRRGTVPAVVAMRTLRCTEESFRQLVDLGLPSTPGPEGPLYDLCDLKNAGLYSGSQATEVEVAMRYLLGHTTEPPEELTRQRRWNYRLRVGSPAGETGERVVYRPTPEVSGGAVESWRAQAGPAPLVDGHLLRLRAGQEVTGTMLTCGAVQPVRSSAIRRAMLDLTGSGVRWQYLPPSFEAYPFEALALGVGTCAVLCSALETALRDDGFEATAYHGWLIAVAQIDHGWVEVLDEDGVVKCLDPSLALLATQNGFGSGAYADFAMGSRSNRIVPTRSPLNHPFVFEPAGATAETVTLTCVTASERPYETKTTPGATPRRLPWAPPVNTVGTP